MADPNYDGNNLNAGELICPVPIKLIDRIPAGDSSGRSDFVLTDEGRNLLSGLPSEAPVRVFGIVGPYRTGKSLIATRLLGERKGFELGDLYEGCTRGIWAWGRFDGDSVLLVLDTEGLNDAKKSTKEDDAMIFTITALISSFLTINVKTKIDKSNIDMLKFASDITKNINLDPAEPDDGNEGTSSGGGGASGSGSGQKRGKKKRVKASELVGHMPDLLFLIRDGQLKVPPGHNTVVDYYRNEIFSIEDHGGDRDDEDDLAAMDRNLVTNVLANAFPSLDVQSLPLPVQDVDGEDFEDRLSRIEELSDDELRPSFVSALQEQMDRLEVAIRPKSVKGRHGMSTLRAEVYADFVNTVCE